MSRIQGSESRVSLEISTVLCPHFGTVQAAAASSSAAISMAPDSDTLPAMDADGKPAWLQRLMGNESSSALLRQQSDISTDEEGGVRYFY